ncbi:MAG: DNA replication and repair protein RecF, partial [Firmicutes bacterium]|nr:DNA replication and repair protein RecF [Bacillota bacterium]
EQEELFYEVIKKSCENDLRQRTTTKGPHKDDLEFFINDINVRSFGSQGQQRTAALSLKLAEISIIEEETGEKPVLLLDDVMSELDAGRQEFLIKSLADIQLFVTTTEIPEKLLSEFPSGNIYTVHGGTIEKSTY